MGDLEVRAAVGDLDAGGIGAGIASGDAAAFGDRLLGVEVDRVDDVPLLDGAPQVAPAAVHLRAGRRYHGTDPGRRTAGGSEVDAGLNISRDPSAAEGKEAVATVGDPIGF